MQVKSYQLSIYNYVELQKYNQNWNIQPDKNTCKCYGPISKPMIGQYV